MRTMSRLSAGAPILLLALSLPAGSAPLPQGQTRAIQMLADVTLVDSQCKKVNANFGVAFGYAQEQGVHPADIMPLGRHRAEFQSASDRRLSTMPLNELCGSFTLQYERDFPGLFAER